ncbi:TetR/AcrR family transcriptional regulator [Pedobacter cryotolerans]|uniref:TetR/AcrR family transcriptional regulator n=1 Tax=Pedobacter cryotolerans TaxID=2571270 RepID=A0A4U1CCR7_9SPHI|nr:TetR/AcrR family transcriptional regulator [Pedobacter cryotolerans]TKC01744.1 TetR/AcrR family transcriptional regulator [Pedobacter cryotolerans]
MAISEKRLRQKEQLRDSILEAAKSIILKEGWQSVSMRKIADAINYSLPVVYNHFESKDAILEEFVRQGFDLLSETVLAAKGKLLQPEEQLNEMAIAYFKFAFEQREYYQMMFGLGMPSCERVKQITEIGNFSNILIDTIKNLGNFSDTNELILLKFHTLWSILHGLSSINMVSMTATPNEMQQRVLQDAIKGFIKNIND